MAETRKLTAEEFEKVKNSGKYTQEQLEKIKDMEIPVDISELSDEQLEDAAAGIHFYISADYWKLQEDAPKRSYTP
ncbi:MAG: hypothetical protein E7508_03870 [Ruminococcus sp.]|nr:hypothetical protein [Ruminococcus sp.]